MRGFDPRVIDLAVVIIVAIAWFVGIPIVHHLARQERKQKEKR
jgi:hypothetical protein